MAFHQREPQPNREDSVDTSIVAKFATSKLALVPDPYSDLREPLRAIAIDSRNDGIVDDAIHFELRDRHLVGCISVAHVSARVERASALERKVLSAGRRIFEGDYCCTEMFSRDMLYGELGLVIGRSRPTLSCELFFDSRYMLRDARFFLSETALERRLTYANGAEYFKDNEAYHEGLAAARRLSEVRIGLGGDAFRTRDDGQIERCNPTDAAQIIRTQPAAFVSAELMIIYNYLASRVVSNAQLEALFRYAGGGTTRSKNKLSLTPRPHEGLGFDQYLRATSPCRSAEDYVNQVILTAAVRAEAAPFCTEELVDISYNLTTIHNDLAARRYSGASSPMISGAEEWSDADPTEFTNQLRDCVDRREFTEALRQEILRRLKAETLDNKDLYNVLFGTLECSSDWAAVRQEIIGTLRHNPKRAVGILDRAASNRAEALLQYEIIATHGKGSGYIVNARYDEGSNYIVSESVIGLSSRDTRALAALSILEQLSDGGWKQQTECGLSACRESEALELRGTHAHADSAEMLRRMVSSLSDSRATYRLSQYRNLDGSVYEAALTVNHADGEYRSRTYRARKREIVELAAEYELVVAHAPHLLESGQAVDNPVQQLFSDCERAHLGRPQFKSEMALPSSGDIYFMVLGYIEVATNQFVSAGPIKCHENGGAKSEVAVALLDKLRRYWGGDTSVIMDSVQLRQWLLPRKKR